MKKATHQQTKEHNNRLVLKTIYQHGDISRAEVARITGLARATVSDIVAELLESGLVAEVSVGQSSGGKPPINISLLDNACQVACLDLSNNDLRGALVNLRGEILFDKTHAVNHKTGFGVLEDVYRLADELVSTATSPLLGIAVGTPGLVDSYAGVVRRAVNWGWEDLPLKQLLSERYQIPVYVANDSHVAALAEYTYGEWSKTPNMLVIKVGQGIGSGIVLSGGLFYGDGFSAGEIGHLSVVENGLKCTCGNLGCLETAASLPSLLRSAHQAAVQFPGSALGKWAAEGRSIDLPALIQLYQQDDPVTRSVVFAAARYLGAAVASFVGILNIRRVILAGTYSAFGQAFLSELSAEMYKRVLPGMAAQTSVVFSTLDEKIVVLGVSALVLSEELGLP